MSCGWLVVELCAEQSCVRQEISFAISEGDGQIENPSCDVMGHGLEMTRAGPLEQNGADIERQCRGVSSHHRYQQSDSFEEKRREVKEGGGGRESGRERGENCVDTCLK